MVNDWGLCNVFCYLFNLILYLSFDFTEKYLVYKKNIIFMETIFLIISGLNPI